MRIVVSTLGCKLNQSEMDTLATQLASLGHTVVASPEEADLCVLNTCAVTHVAAQKTRQALRRLHRANPSARLVATGCYAELSPTELEKLPGVDLVVGNQDKAQLPTLLDSIGSTAGIESPISSLKPPTFRLQPQMAKTRTRTFLKIQDGCDNACTYCIIRVARGRQRSRALDGVLAEVRARLAAGYREVVLTGVHIGAYGRDWEAKGTGADLWALVKRILNETEVPRLRLSSIEPWDLPEDSLSIWEDPRLCRHLHLPLQSGCDAVLGRMARRYTTAQFGALVDGARAAIPDLAVTTDVIVGFPGETQEEAAEALSFVRAMGFAHVHVFPYSCRPGTPAAGLPDQVLPAVKAERARAMREIAAASAQEFRGQFIRRTMSVLWESSRRGEFGPVWSGLTDNYLRVYAVSSENLANRQTAVQLVALTKGGLRGELLI
jgi:threonylcarbamoyladenosine tRNA methylthiotransferase MtaB